MGGNAKALPQLPHSIALLRATQHLLPNDKTVQSPATRRS
jgi:hypothetical protein